MAAAEFLEARSKEADQSSDRVMEELWQSCTINEGVVFTKKGRRAVKLMERLAWLI